MMKFVAVRTKKPIVEQTPVTNTSKKIESKPDFIPLPTKKEIEQMEEIVRLFKKNESKEVPVTINEVAEEKPAESDPDDALKEMEDIPDDDSFELLTGGVFYRDEVIKIDLPKFMIKNDIKNVNVVDEKSTVVLTLMATNINQDIGKRIFGAIKNGFKEFKINFNDLEDETVSVWKFTNVKIKTVDMGSLESIGREEPRTIMCELEYDDFSIDNETLY